MPDDGFMLGATALAQIQELIDDAGTRRRNPPTDRGHRGIHRNAEVNPVRVSSATPVSGRYPGFVSSYDWTAKTYSDLLSCWVVGRNGETLAATGYVGRLAGIVSGVPVYLVCSTAPAGVAAAAAFSGARVYNTAGQTLTATVAAAVLFDTERWDVGGYHSVSVNTSRFTIPATGYYHVGACVEFLPTPPHTSYYTASLLVNGATTIAKVVEDRAASSQNVEFNLATDYYFGINDYVELFVYFSAGAAATGASTNHSPEFWIHSIGT